MSVDLLTWRRTHKAISASRIRVLGWKASFSLMVETQEKDSSLITVFDMYGVKKNSCILSINGHGYKDMVKEML